MSRSWPAFARSPRPKTLMDESCVRLETLPCMVQFRSFIEEQAFTLGRSKGLVAFMESARCQIENAYLDPKLHLVYLSEWSPGGDAITPRLATIENFYSVSRPTPEA